MKIVLGQIDKTLFITKNRRKDFIIIQFYIEDRLFKGTNDCLWKEFLNLMNREFKMSMVGDLQFFLGLQIK